MFNFRFDRLPLLIRVFCYRYKDIGNLESIVKVIERNAASQMQSTIGNMTSFLTKKDDTGRWHQRQQYLTY